MEHKFSDVLSVGSQRKVRDNGFLEVPSRLGRSGIQEYRAFELGMKDRKPTDIVRVYRPEEEVFSDSHIEALENIVVTNDHPADFVDANNAKELQVGIVTSGVIRDGNFLDGKLLITDAKTIKDITDGKNQISLGYSCELSFEDGMYGDIPYDAVQRNLKPNHAAIVSAARAGELCIMADSMENLTDEKVDIGTHTHTITTGDHAHTFAVTDKVAEPKEDEDEDEKDEKKEKLNDSFTFEDSTYEVTDAKVLGLLEGMQLRLADQAVLQDKVTTLLEQVECLKDAQITDSQIEAMVLDRLDTCSKAQKIQPSIVLDGKSPEQIKAEVVKAKYPTIEVANKDAAYIEGLFDSLALTTKPHQAIDSAFTDRAPVKTHTKPINVEELARQQFISKNRQV